LDDTRSSKVGSERWCWSSSERILRWFPTIARVELVLDLGGLGRDLFHPIGELGKGVSQGLDGVLWWWLVQRRLFHVLQEFFATPMTFVRIEFCLGDQIFLAA
jgi:hypothetical protein